MTMKYVFRNLVVAFALIASSLAANAQCSGQFPNNTVCGYSGGASRGLPSPIVISPSVLDPIAGGTVIGNPTSSSAVPQATSAPVLGIPGTSTGEIGLAGSTSGTAILKAQTAAGTAISLLPTAAGTLVGTAGAPLMIDATTGQITITGLAGGILAGSAPAFTRTPTLGDSGSFGSISFGNATSGLVTLQTVTGALGTPTVLLPAASGTVAVSASSPITLDATTGAVACATCVTSSGGGSITGTAPIAVSAAGVVSITGQAGGVLAGSAPTFTPTPVLGIPGTTAGSLGFAGLTSGTATITAQATAGTPTITLPNASGTIAVSASSPLVLSATTGDLTCPTCATSSTPSGAALTASNDTNVTLTLGGSPTTALLNASSITAGWNGQLSLTRGGTNASLTASNGGVVYSTASAFGILAGTATANQVLLSGSNASPAWSTATYPAATTINQILYSSATNTVVGLATANGGILNTSSGGIPSITATPTLGVNGGTGGQITLNGTTSGAVALKVASAAGTGTIFQFPANNGTNTYVLQTDGAGVTSWVPSAGGGTVSTITAGNGISLSSGATCTTTCTISADIATGSNYLSATANKLLDAAVVYQAETTTSFSATPTFDFSTFYNTKITLTSNITSITCSNQKAGQSGTIRFIQDATGSRTLPATFGCNFKFASGTQPVLSTTANLVDAIVYSCSATNYCVASLIKDVR